ncbi:major facilitator superfamily domain-containing protein [Xylaria sp. CBS 124048]|nr:major facilitator superfamily domain-containing protein [Xylaria sp. CBS 124048]
MAQEQLFKDPIWSRDGREISRLSGITATWNGVYGRVPHHPILVSKFSADSDDDSQRSMNPNSSSDSPHRGARRLLGHRTWPRPRTLGLHMTSWMPRRHIVNRVHNQNEDEERPCTRLQSNSTHPNSAPTPKEWQMPSFREILFVVTICIAHLCAQAGIGQTLPITRDLGSRFRVTNADNLSSAIVGYVVGLGTFVLIAGRLGEIFGHKRIMIVGLLWSAAWSLVVGASFYSTRSLFVIARVAQGLGAGLTLPTGLSLLTVTFPTGIGKEVVLALYAAMSPVGIILGVLGAGVLTKLTWWPWIYWAFSITLVVLAIISCSAIPSIPQENRQQHGASAIVSELDIPGMVTGTVSLGLFVFVWSQAQDVGWEQSYLWIILVISALLAGLFVMIEACYAQRPLIPFKSFSPEVFWILVAVGCSWSSFAIWLFYSWQFIGRLRSATLLMNAAYFSPIAFAGCVAAVGTPLLTNRIGHRATFSIAMLAMMVGGVLMVTIPVEQIYWKQLFFSILTMAWGVYTSVPAGILMVSDAMNEKHGDIAASLVCTISYFALGLGLAVAGTVNSSIIASDGLTIYSRVRGYRASYWMSVGLAGFGFIVCSALTLASWLFTYVIYSSIIMASNLTVNVKNISSETKEQQIREFFSFCGKITDLKVSQAADGTQEATVTFEKETAAKTAQLLNNTQLGSSQIAVSSADGQPDDGAPHSGSINRDTDHIAQEEKPRSRILAEYLAHGYVIGDATIQRAIELDNKHGVSTRFMNTLTQLDQKFHATDRAKAADQSYGISHRANVLFGGLTSYFEKASNTPTGKKLVKFYTDSQRQVQDIHAEAQRLRQLKMEEHGGDAYKASGLERIFGKEKTQATSPSHDEFASTLVKSGVYAALRNVSAKATPSAAPSGAPGQGAPAPEAAQPQAPAAGEKA